ncbi:hypothetical protein SAMN04488587_0541 [Methanococcoides vulcani]|uniref:PGF-CTERM protein n=1 Tax=Methanococcoides vulcani TaxID=1353158 RepID=A0A1H9YG89_9EURY|nr:hypothetical protein SAMN04488587_0541 [Methanococcoides vulcani]
MIIGIMLVGFAWGGSFDTVNNDDNELDDPEHTDRITDSNNPDSRFEEYKSDPLFIASRGTFPKTIDWEWENSVHDCWLSLSINAPAYTIDSSIRSIGTNSEFLIVGINSDQQGKMNGSRIDEIYRKIDDHCEREEGISGISVVFMWPMEDESIPLPEYGPEIFEEAKSSSSFIAAYGTMPVINQDSEKRRWTDQLGYYMDRELDPFFAESDGPVIGYGVSINGYLSVGMDLENPEKVNESVIDEIYQMIDRHFEQEAGINEVPVVFEWEENAVEDIGVEDTTPSSDEEDICVIDDDGNVITYTRDEAYLDEDGNLVIIDNGTQEEIGTENQTPGFTSIMLIIGLFLSASLRK